MMYGEERSTMMHSIMSPPALIYNTKDYICHGRIIMLLYFFTVMPNRIY
jgi:hypothetical protein